MLATLTFVTPSGALLALAVVLPLGAFTVSALRSTRARVLLGLAPPPPGREGVLAALAAVPAVVLLVLVVLYRYTNCRIGSVITSVVPSGETASTDPVTDAS